MECAEAELFLRRLQPSDYFPSVPRIHQEFHFKAKLWFGQRNTATVGISKLGVPGLLPVCCPKPLAEPGVRLSSHRAPTVLGVRRVAGILRAGRFLGCVQSTHFGLRIGS